MIKMDNNFEIDYNMYLWDIVICIFHDIYLLFIKFITIFICELYLNVRVVCILA